MLSNFEVMEALKNIKDTKSKFGLRNLATITYEVNLSVSPSFFIGIETNYSLEQNHFQTFRFLEESLCKTQSKENILGFLEAIRPFKLSKAECLTIVNDPPSTPLHIQLQIEDSEERLTEEEVTQIIEISKQWLLPRETQ